jgi:ketosteroid isomerase-like protein
MTDPDRDPDNVALVRRFLETVDAGTRGELAVDAFVDFYHPDVEQVEHPNRFNPKGARRDRDALHQNAGAGRALMKEQRYQIVSAIGQGDRVAVEAVWTGVLAVPLGPLPAGHQLRAHLGMFFEIKDGRIWRQRNYDCFEP